MSLSARLLPRAVVTLALIVASSRTVLAQACIGGPAGSRVAFEHTTYSLGSGIGGSAALAGKRTALDVNFQSRSIATDFSGMGGGLRFSIIIPISKLLVCPGLGIDGSRDEFDVNPTTSISTTAVAARAGAGFGFEQSISDDLSVIPFGGVYYRFNAIMYETDAPGETFTTADSSSHVQFQYGVAARFRFLFVGVAAERTSDTSGSRADLGRIFVGLTSSRKRD